ncbi:MAG: 3-coathanger stack domain-containing protein [Bacteroidota bacterium]
MKTQFYRLIVTLLFVNFSVLAWSQKVPASLQQRLAGKTKLVDIMKEVDLFYDFGRSPLLKNNQEGEEFENAYIHWKRFEYLNASRLDANGNIDPDANKKMMQGLNDYKAAHPQYFNTNALQNFSYGSWSNFGPSAITRYGTGYNSGFGRVNCIAFHPTDENTLFIGMPQGGIWRSTNNGSSWSALSDDIPSGSVSGIVVDYNNANTIYVLTGDGDASGGGFVSSYGFLQQSVGVLKSTDGGDTWNQTGTFPSTVGAFYGYKLIQHPTISSTLFAATTDGIYRTTNSGTTWTLEQVGNFTDIEFRPGIASTMYAVARGGSDPFWKSTNSGATWSNAGISGDPGTASRLAIGVSAANNTYVYLLCGPATGAGSFRGVYRSTNSGEDFSLRTTTPNILGYPTNGSDDEDQAGYDLGIEVDPNDADEIITCGINIWRSTNGGTTMVNETYWQDNVASATEYVHADVHNLTYHPNNINKIFAVSDGGVGISLNDGVDWDFISGGLQIMATYHADWYEPNSDLMANGTQDNGTNVKYGATNTLRHIYGADGFDCVIDQNNILDIVYVANGSVSRTTDGGLTRTSITPTGVGTFPQLARSFGDDNDILAGGSASVFRSTNRGTSWIEETTPSGNRVLTTCQSNSNRVYAGSGTALWRSDDKGVNWSAISGNPGWPTGVNITDLDSRPSNSTVIWACFGGYTEDKKVYYSSDSGRNWSNLSGSLPNVACHSITLDLRNTVYVGTDIGVFVRPSGESDWQPYLNGLPKTPVSELMANNTDSTIIACTFGRGNFIDSFYRTCRTSGTLIVSGTLSGNRFYEYDAISSSATVTGGQGTNVLMKGVDNVTLTEGFEAKSGNLFKAYYGPCGSGGVQFGTAQSLTETISMETAFIAAEDGKRWPYAHFTDIDNKNKTVEISVATAGAYAIRLAKGDGSVAAVLSPSINLAAGTHSFNVAGAAQIGGGFYYIQLFKDGRMVHFQEYVPE